MQHYSMLNQMGVQRIHEINRFTLSEEADHCILKLYFNITEQSHLPASEKFYLSDKQDIQLALSELNQLTNNNHANEKSDWQQLANQLDSMEQLMSAKISELKNKLARL